MTGLRRRAKKRRANDMLRRDTRIARGREGWRRFGRWLSSNSGSGLSVGEVEWALSPQSSGEKAQWKSRQEDRPPEEHNARLQRFTAVRISYGKYKEPSSEEYEQNGDEQRGGCSMGRAWWLACRRPRSR